MFPKRFFPTLGRLGMLMPLALVIAMSAPTAAAAAAGPNGTVIDPNGAVCNTYVNPDGSKVQKIVVHSPGVRYSSLFFNEVRWTAYAQYAPMAGGTWTNLRGATQTGTINKFWRSVQFSSQTIWLTSSNQYQFRVLNQIQFLNGGRVVGTSDWLASPTLATYSLAYTGWSSQEQGRCTFP